MITPVKIGAKFCAPQSGLALAVAQKTAGLPAVSFNSLILPVPDPKRDFLLANIAGRDLKNIRLGIGEAILTKRFTLLAEVYRGFGKDLNIPLFEKIALLYPKLAEEFIFYSHPLVKRWRKSLSSKILAGFQERGILESYFPKKRRQVLDFLSSLEVEGWPEALQEELKTETNPEVARSIIAALEKIGDKKSIPILKAKIKNPELTAAVIEALAEIGGEAAVKILAGFLQTRYAEEAARALGLVGSAQAREVLLEAVQDKKFTETWKVIDILADCFSESMFDDFAALLDQLDPEDKFWEAVKLLRYLFSFNPEKALIPIKKMLKNDSRVIFSALEPAEIIKFEKYHFILEKMLSADGREKGISAKAALALALRGDNRYFGKAVDLVCSLLKQSSLSGEDLKFCQAGIRIMGEYGKEYAANLFSIWHSNYIFAQNLAIEMLLVAGEIEKKEAFRFLAERYSQIRDSDYKKDIINFLKKITDESIVPDLLEMYENKTVEQGFVLSVLPQVKSQPARDFLLKLLGREGNKYCIKEIREALRESADPDMLIQLIEVYKTTPNLDVKAEIIKNIGQIGGEEGAGALVEIWQVATSDPKILTRILHALSQTGSNLAVPVLLEALQHLKAEVKLAAAELLADFRLPSVSYALVRVLRSKNPALRLEAALSLLKLGSRKGLFVLFEFFQGDQQNLRERINRAIVEDAGGPELLRDFYVRLEKNDWRERFYLAEKLLDYGSEEIIPLLIEHFTYSNQGVSDEYFKRFNLFQNLENYLDLYISKNKFKSRLGYGRLSRLVNMLYFDVEGTNKAEEKKLGNILLMFMSLNPDLENKCIRAIIKLGEVDTLRTLLQQVLPDQFMIAELSRVDLSVLVSLLDYPEIKRVLAQALILVGAPAVPDLIKALASPQTLESASQILAKIPGIDLAPLVRALRNPNPNIREQAQKILAAKMGAKPC